MGLVLNTNTASLTAQKNLARSQDRLAQAVTRLSSGLRINSAKDDAAGLAISERMGSQVNGINQAVRNANDGISLTQIAEGAMSEISNNLQRIRELAIQSANGTNTAADRAALNAEVQQRLQEIDRIASQSAYSGQKILDGSFGTVAFQVGANVGESISVDMTGGSRITQIGAIASTTTANLSTAATAATAGQLTVEAGTRLFGSGAIAQVDGNFVGAAAATTDFSTAGSAQIDGVNVQTVTGYDFSGLNLAQFDVNGQSVTLNTNTTDDAGLASAIQAQLTGITVEAAAPGVLLFTNTGNTAAVAITSADANAVTAGFVNDAGFAGSAAVASTNASFTVDGIAVNLTTDLGTRAGVAAEIQAQLEASAGAGSYSVSAGGGGELTITHNSSLSAVTIAGLDANEETLTGLSNAVGNAGSSAVATTNATFNVDGNAVTLDQDYASFDLLAADIEDQLGAGYSVSNSNGAITIARTTTGSGSTAVEITATDTQATTAGFGIATGTAGTDPQVGGIAAGGSFTLASGDLTLASGSNASIDLAGTYSNMQALVDAINSRVSGVNASTSGGTLTLTSAQAITAGGNLGTVDASLGGFGLSATTEQNANNGTLSSADVSTVAGANTTVERVDSAISAINSMRINFGAIQNRFDSVIANLQSTSENVMAAKSRIQDADYATETANLTKASILQQAGVAMLAQANALPQQILALLRG